MHTSGFIRYIVLLLALTAGGLVGCDGTQPIVPDEGDDPLQGERINSFYTNEEISYLLDIALWRDTVLQEPVITKWYAPIRISVHGNPTEEDLKTLGTVVEELNGLAREIEIGLSNEKPNLDIYFVPRAAYSFVDPDYRFPDFGYTSWWPRDFVKTVSVLVATDSTTQDQRNGWIYRGLAASLGLTNLSAKYPESVFYEGWTPTPGFRYAPVDRTIIEILYSSGIWPGMTRQAVVHTLTNR